MKWNSVVSYAVAASLMGKSAIVSAEGAPFKIDFNIYRGNSKRDLVDENTDKAYFSKRDGFLDMELQNKQTFYLATLKIGSNKDVNGVLVDTGSSDLWVMSHDMRCDITPDQNAKRGTVFDSRYDIEQDLLDAASKPPPTPTVKDTKVSKVAQNKAWWNPFGGGGTDYYTTIYYTETAAPDVIGSGSGYGSGEQAASNTCTSYGSFNTEKSESFQRNTTANAFTISYADNTEAFGVWGYDNVIIGNTTVANLSFAVVNETSSDVGVLGIGLSGLETTYSTLGGGNYQYENLPIKLVNQGIIHKNVYSLYLGEADAKTGSILFGAIDHSKFSGTLQTVPIINTNLQKGYTEAIRIEIIVNDISLISGSQNSSVSTNVYSAVLDTGSTLSYFPPALLQKLGQTLGGQYSSAIEGYVVPCTNDESVKVAFNFSGKVIEVPLPELLLRRSTNSCYLGILQQTDSNYILFGDNFLRSAYVVYNLEDFEVSLAPVQHNDEEDIEIITSTVPGAVRAAGFSSTSLGSGAPRESSNTNNGAGHTTGATTTTSTSSPTSNHSSDAVSSMKSAFSFKMLFTAILLVAFVAFV
ncbi:aspartic peptidase domain-containing protein [Scheffersomyces xylosifermentans]|uniref:aspartic peptidase domain-containing protein n=1 Tax=Scheffersomyces xylosifermentans TaxID=1304137 RepID=UPI00315DCD63